MTYLTKQFRLAVTVLCGNGPVKQRLAQAYLNHLDELHEDELAPELRRSFADIRSRLHAVKPAGGESAARASVRKMSPPQAADCSRIIVELYEALLRQESDGRLLHLVETGDEPAPVAVPRFLLKN